MDFQVSILIPIHCLEGLILKTALLFQKRVSIGNLSTYLSEGLLYISYALIHET